MREGYYARNKDVIREERKEKRNETKRKRSEEGDGNIN